MHVGICIVAVVVAPVSVSVRLYLCVRRVGACIVAVVNARVCVWGGTSPAPSIAPTPYSAIMGRLHRTTVAQGVSPCVAYHALRLMHPVPRILTTPVEGSPRISKPGRVVSKHVELRRSVDGAQHCALGVPAGIWMVWSCWSQDTRHPCWDSTRDFKVRLVKVHIFSHTHTPVSWGLT